MRRSITTLLSLTASTLAFAASAQAQTAATPPVSDPVEGATPQDAVPDDDPANTVVVTGTRAANRTVADSPVPIDVISSEALQSSGLGEVNKILNNLVPSFNFPQPSITDGTDVIRPASLRGLAPDQTLVLVNGKRRHVSALLNVNGSVGRGSAAVDLNTIPSLAIDRIEVLRDGASSQYGSDAIAGVINVQLKRANHGGRAQVSYGKYVTTMEGVPNVTGLLLTGGQPTFDPADTRILAASRNGERKANDGDLWTLGFNIGLPIGAEGYVNLTTEYRDRQNTNRAGFDLRPNYNRPGAAFDAREIGFNRLNFQYGDPQTEDVNVFVNAGVPLGTFELYAFGSYSTRDGLSAANFRQSSSANNRDWSTITPATTPNAGNFVPLRPDGFLPFIHSKLEDYSAAIGIRGDVGGWSTDLSVVYGHNQFDYRTENSLNTSYGPQSLSNFDSGGLAFGQLTANLDVSHEFELGLAKPLTFALGAEYRKDDFNIRPGETQSYAIGPFFRAAFATTAANCATQGGVYAAATGICSFPGLGALVGAQGFPGFPESAATDVSRHSYAGYVELDTDLFDGFTVTAAGRYEHFSDFGETLNGKLAARYEFTQGFAVRGSVSNGFRAPSLHQQYFTTTSTNFIGGVPVEISTQPVTSPVAQALGARELEPEKSFNWTAGATLNPFRGFNLTADYYHIKIDDRVVLTENLGAAGSGTAAVNAAVKAILDANGFQSVGAARFFINGLDTTTEGVDVVGTYRFGVEGLGNWSLSAAYNRNTNKITRRISDLGPLAQIPGLILFGRVEGIRFTNGQPKDKVVLSADGSLGAFGITARSTRYGQVIAPGAATPLTAPTSLTAYGPDDLFLEPKWVTDLEVRVTLKEHATFAFGANNLFDVYPTARPTGARPSGVGGFYPVDAYYQPYSGFSPFGFNGRFLYGRFSTQF
ncbi:TonB-dependent receptor [Sphingomonas sp. IC-56]|uniref:TonB-dependent receptor plug domain-containing protein n=1 Tax=Sphingomonas sp. IC-56 TaxID=2898529 RepID=UPI001E5D805F|nr:TonB-dependent receptor [Sphingomonas sp. IC-56]MCD2325213.1 TonB-dependent receptor [Sphingomonas sp. IC-56]